MIDLSFIILTWNSDRHINRCIDTFMLKCINESIEWEVIIIDNGSIDQTCSFIKKYIENYEDKFKLISLDKNYGTTYSRNIGLDIVKGSACCVLDSDTEFYSGSISDVLNILNDQTIGIVAPKLMFDDGTVQQSVKKFPTFIDKIKKIPGIIFGMGVKKDDFYTFLPMDKSINVDTAISACWFFKKSLLNKIGFLDEKIFYAPEDVEYCYRVHQAGMKIVYYPFLSITHHTQQITHRKPFSSISLSHFFGLLYYFKKHGGWFRRPTFRH